MSGDAPKESTESNSESKSTEQSSLWADIARDMAIGGAVGGAVAGPVGTILGTEAGLAYGLLSHSSEATDLAKHLFDSVIEFAQNPMVQKAIKEVGQPLMLPEPARQLVEEKSESLLDNDTLRTAAEILFPPLAI